MPYHRQVIDEDLDAPLGQFVDHMGADESGPSGNQYFHVYPYILAESDIGCY